MTYSAKVDKQSKLMLMRGPRLCGGDGTFGEVKDEAQFPGLEYLGPGVS